MANEWTSLTLDEAGITLYDCEHKTPAAAKSGYPYIGIPQMKNGHLDVSDARLVSKEDWPEWTRRVTPQPGDVILSRRTNPGETAVVPPGLECVLGQNLVILRADGSRVVPEYLRWAVRGPEWWEQIRSNLNVGAVFDSLKCRDIPNFRLTFPPIHEQQRIAQALGSLDDKIELNRRMNETLEGMARALFKSWFVDYDPVRAKADGRGTGLPPKLDALFPDSLVDTALGEVPEGWGLGPLSSIATIRSGGTPKTTVKEYWDGDIPWFSIKDAPAPGQVFVTKTEKTITDLGLANSVAQILPPRCTIISARGTVGKLAVPSVPMAMNQSCFALKDSTSRGDWFVYYTIMASVGSLQQASHGSVFDTINRVTFQSIQCAIPPQELCHAFEKAAEPLLARVLANVLQSETLQDTRDLLLPRLISGTLQLTAREASA